MNSVYQSKYLNNAKRTILHSIIGLICNTVILLTLPLSLINDIIPQITFCLSLGLIGVFIYLEGLVMLFFRSEFLGEPTFLISHFRDMNTSFHGFSFLAIFFYLFHFIYVSSPIFRILWVAVAMPVEELLLLSTIWDINYSEVESYIPPKSTLLFYTGFLSLLMIEGLIQSIQRDSYLVLLWAFLMLVNFLSHYAYQVMITHIMKSANPKASQR